MSFKALMALLMGLLFSHALLAANVSLQIHRPYVVHMLDGAAFKRDLLSRTSELHLAPGDHQLVLRFEASYRAGGESRVISGDPLVINFRADDNHPLLLDFAAPRSYAEAEHFLEQQPVRLINLATRRPWPAEIFIMPKREGLQIGRNYQAELVALGKAFGQQSQAQPGTSAPPSTEPAPTKNPPLNDNNAQALEMLKYWYNRADPQTRKAFQHWIISQPPSGQPTGNVKG